MTIQPIKFYTGYSPAAMGVQMLLDFLEIPHEDTVLDFHKGDPKSEWFTKINPNGRFPAIIDPNNGDFKLWESAAIMMYLADRYDKDGKWYPKDANKRAVVNQWIMFQISGFSSMKGQTGHFIIHAEDVNVYAIRRYNEETKRLEGVVERHLRETGNKYLTGDDMTIVDLNILPWMFIGQDALGDAEEYTQRCPLLRAYQNRCKEHPIIRKLVDETTKPMMESDIGKEIVKKIKARMAAAYPDA